MIDSKVYIVEATFHTGEREYLEPFYLKEETANNICQEKNDSIADVLIARSKMLDFVKSWDQKHPPSNNWLVKQRMSSQDKLDQKNHYSRRQEEINQIWQGMVKEMPEKTRNCIDYANSKATFKVVTHTLSSE